MDHFSGDLRIYYQCQLCGRGTERKEIFLQLNLSVPEDARRLETCINNFFSCETVQRICGTCQKMTSAKRYSKLFLTPKVLCFHLKRFRNDRSKITREVTIPLKELLMEDTVSMQSYSLSGFICHIGRSIRSGHYISYNKVMGKWYRYSDERVDGVSEKEVYQAMSDAYILFYKY